MKLTTILLLSLFIISCKKEISTTSKTIKVQRKLTLEVDDFNNPNLRKPTINPGKGNKPPRDTTVIVDSPFIYNGQRVLYVETNGTTVSNTSWNVSGDFYATPCSYTEVEIQNIVDTLKGLSVYGQFPVLVTRDKNIYNATPTLYRQMEIITDYNEWYGNSAGGVAYRNSFGVEQPCFVFSKMLNARNAQLASVHEFGHTLGLPHDAVGYFDSNGVWVLQNIYSNGNNWMGAGYNTSFHTFSTESYDPNGTIRNQFLIINNTLR